MATLALRATLFYFILFFHLLLNFTIMTYSSIVSSITNEILLANLNAAATVAFEALSLTELTAIGGKENQDGTYTCMDEGLFTAWLAGFPTVVASPGGGTVIRTGTILLWKAGDNSIIDTTVAVQDSARFEDCRLSFEKEGKDGNPPAVVGLTASLSGISLDGEPDKFSAMFPIAYIRKQFPNVADELLVKHFQDLNKGKVLEFSVRHQVPGKTGYFKSRALLTVEENAAIAAAGGFAVCQQQGQKGKIGFLHTSKNSTFLFISPSTSAQSLVFENAFKAAEALKAERLRTKNLNKNKTVLLKDDLEGIQMLVSSGVISEAESREMRSAALAKFA